MFGFVDKFCVGKWNKKPPSKDWDWRPMIIDDGFNEVWYCFVPSEVMNSQNLRERLIPPKGKVVIYTSSYKNMIFADAEKTKRLLEKIYSDAKQRMLNDFKKYQKINISGISLGNIFSVRLAHDVPEKKVGDFVSIVGALHPGRVAWNSIATSKVARMSGYKSEKEYGEALAEFAPSQYFKDFHVRKIFARFGKFDLMVPYKPYGRELKNVLKSVDASFKDIKTYRFAGHVLSIYESSKEDIYDKLK